MPSYKGHLAGGAAAFVIVLFAITSSIAPSFAALLEWLLLCLLGSLFPDIDIKSKGQKLFYVFMLILLIYLMLRSHYDAMIFITICGMVPLIVRHRGIFHRLWFIIALPASIAWLICVLWLPECSTIIFYDALFFITGAVSHLLLDVGPRRILRW